jgi:hypothetical protein
VRFDRARPARSFPEGQGVTSIGIAVFASAVGAAVAAFGVAGPFARQPS